MKSFLNIIRCSCQAYSRVFMFDKPAVILALFVSLLIALQSNINIYLSKLIVDQLTTNNQYWLYGTVALLISFQLIRLFFESYSTFKNRKMEMAFAVHCENKLIDLIARTELLVKEHPQYTGDFSYWTYINSKYLDSYSTLTQLVKQGLIAAISLSYLLYYHFYIGLLALFIGTAKGVYDLKAVHRRTEINEKIMRQSRVYHYFFDILTSSHNQKEVTLFQLVPYFRQKWLEKKTEANGLSMQLETLNIKRKMLGEILSILSSGVIIIIIAILVFRGSYTIGDYVAITLALALTENNVTMVFNSISILKENTIHIDKLSEIENDVLATARESIQESLVSFRFENKIQVENLTFYYPNRAEPVLKNITLEIRKGELVAILGGNGSGKSTLIKLLLGLYIGDSGSILYDGLSARELDRSSMWNKTSVVFQDYIKFMTDVRDNIAVGNIAEVDNSVKLLSALEKVGMLNIFEQRGLDTKLGMLEDNAVNLSGGQWQRLALSRVFISDRSELVLFDEPTSALDPVSEVKIMNEMLEHCCDKTVIMVSHRVGIARKADRIIVIDQGRIVESGSHNDLLDKQGAYYEMWHQQKQWYE